YITAFPNEKFYGFADHAVDPFHHAFFQIVGDSINNYLMNFDMNTGALNNILFVVDSVGSGLPGTTSISSNIMGPFYNCVDDKIYFFHSKAHSQDYIHFARVARTTGIVEELNSFQAFIWPPFN